MKYPFKLSKSNIIYAAIVSIIIILFNFRIYGFDGYTVGYSLGSIIGAILFPTLVALLFWFLLGRKENGGTTTFNIVLTLMLFGSIIEFSQMLEDRQKPIDDLQKAVFEYKENTLSNPDSVATNYAELSTNVNIAIDDLIKTSYGEEKKIYLTLKNYLKKSDSVNAKWNNSYQAFMEPRILNFTKLNNDEEYEYQKKVVQNYIDDSENFKNFVQNRVDYLKSQTKHIDSNNKAFKGFMKGIINKDSVQKPIFIPYINAHIDYGKNTKGIIELLERENGKWKNDNGIVKFQNPKSQVAYETLLENAIQNEETVNEYSEKLVGIM